LSANRTTTARSRLLTRLWNALLWGIILLQLTGTDDTEEVAPLAKIIVQLAEFAPDLVHRSLLTIVETVP
jgi:hypothetical protein